MVLLLSLQIFPKYTSNTPDICIDYIETFKGIKMPLPPRYKVSPVIMK